MGMPKLKTDNGPAYTSKSFTHVCAQFSLKHATGIPYSPQRQDIIERSNQLLKTPIQKLAAGDLTYASPHHTLSHSLFVLNFLNKIEGLSSMQRHWNPQVQPFLWYTGRMFSPRNGKGQIVCFPPGRVFSCFPRGYRVTNLDSGPSHQTLH